MNPNRILWFFSFLIMWQLNEAASIVQPKSSLTSGNCSNFVSTPLDFVNVERFRYNVKQEVKRLNCTFRANVTEADLENPKDYTVISSDSFCTSALNASRMTVNSTLFPNLNHILTKIFTDRTLCLVVCTKDLNETLWPCCEVIGNLFELRTAKVPSNVATKPLELEAKKIVSNQLPNAERKAKPVVSVGSQNAPAGSAKSAESQKNTADSAQSAKTKVDSPLGIDDRTRMEGSNADDLENAPAEEAPNSAPTKTEKTLDLSKKIVQGTVNASNQSGKFASAVNVPSKSLPRTAIVTGTANLRPENDESHYFIYFVLMSILCIFCYVGIYNKKKILALVIEGRKQKDRRRHASAGYRKLNTNLEEVMPLGTAAPATDPMIY